MSEYASLVDLEPVEAVGIMSKGGARTHDYGFIRPE